MPLILHSSSHCDVCLDNWNPPGNPPFAIACGHIFCRKCLTSLEHVICPLCRKAFSIDRLKKLHVDLPDGSDIPTDPALQLLQRVALVSGNEPSLDELVGVVEEAKAFLASHSSDKPYYLPLRAAIEALDRFTAMQEVLEKQAHAHEEKRRSWKHKVYNARASLKTAQTVEQNLLQQLQTVQSECETLTRRLAEVETDLARSQSENGHRSRSHTLPPLPATYYSRPNPLPPPPEPVSFDIVPSLRSKLTKNGSSHSSSNAVASRGHHRHDALATGGDFVIVGHPAPEDAARGRSRKERSSRKQDAVPGSSHTDSLSSSWSHQGIRPGAPPALRVIPQTPMVSMSSHSKARGKNKERSGRDDGVDPSAHQDPDQGGVSANTFGARSDSVHRRGYSLDALPTLAHDWPWHGFDPARYVSSYAPTYQDAAPSPSQSLSQQGLGLEGVPELQTGSVTNRSALFRLNATSSTRDRSPMSNMHDLTLLHSTTRPPTAPVQTVGDVLSASRTGLARDRRRNSPNSSITTSSWGTVITGNDDAMTASRGSLGSLDLLQNLDNLTISPPGDVSLEEAEQTPRILNDTAHSRVRVESPLPMWGQDTQSSNAMTVPRGLSASQRDRPRRSGSPSHSPMPPAGDNRAAHNGAPIEIEQAASRHPETTEQGPTDLSAASTNALALVLGPPASVVRSASRGSGTTSDADSGRPRIHAPAPRTHQNPLRAWSGGSLATEYRRDAPSPL